MGVAAEVLVAVLIICFLIIGAVALCCWPLFEVLYQKIAAWRERDRRLIEVMNRLEQQHKVKGLRTWWKEHQKVDRERQIREEKERRKKELKSSALAKLTSEEIEALNIR